MGVSVSIRFKEGDYSHTWKRLVHLIELDFITGALMGFINEKRQSIEGELYQH